MLMAGAATSRLLTFATQTKGFVMSGKGMPGVMSRARATAAKAGTVKRAAARADAAAPAATPAIAAGAVPVVSNAADDLQTLSAQVVALRGTVNALVTNYNDLLAKLRTAGHIAAA